MATLCIWHGYLLGGTGSNIYTSYILDAWVNSGHDVVLMCQEPQPERHPAIHEHEFVRGREVVDRRELVAETREERAARGQGTCTMVQADIGGLLPVYILDRYPGWQHVKRFVDLEEGELARYCDAYAEAMEGVIDRFSPAGVLINHVVMGPPALREVLERRGVPYAVKVHGSELEYAIAEDDRFVAPARTGLEGATSILVGSHHIARRMDDLLGRECSAGRVELVPPGVDLDLFAPARVSGGRREVYERLVLVLRDREQVSSGRAATDELALQQVLHREREQGSVDLVRELQQLHGGYQERDPELGATASVEALDVDEHTIVSFVGKLIRQKGPQLLLAAAPLVLQRHPQARFLVVGFGPLREALGAMVWALSCGDRELLGRIIERGNAFDGGPDEPFAYLPGFYRWVEEDPARSSAYFDAAAELEHRVFFTGPVNHEVLSALWPLCRASVVPSIAAEAFGMVSAEAAACASPPVLAYHSGLADVADAIEEGYPSWAKELVSFDLAADDPVRELAGILTELCELDEERHAEVAAAARAVVEREWGWTSIAHRIATIFAEGPAGEPSDVAGAVAAPE